MKVKICGIQDRATAEYASRAGADMIGFVFAPSRRRVTVDVAKEISRGLPESICKVGVFVNPALEEVELAIQEVGLDYVQFHGDETPAFCKQVGIPVIKAFSVQSVEDVAKAFQYDVEYYLFDSPGGKYRGGSGVPFHWGILRELQIPREKVILAGGLTPENVEQAIGEVGPAIVDVSSGVETDGQKDFEKMKLFLKRAKGGNEIEI